MINFDLPSCISRNNLEYAWRYQDQEGELLMITCRYKCPKKGKRFVPYHLNETAVWQMGAGGQPYSLYGLNLLKYYNLSNIVFISEGEKAATAVQHLDLLGITSPFGADSCSKTDWSPLKTYNQFIILPDQDDPGEKYSQEVAELLLSINSEALIWICHLPGLPKGGDVVDWLKSQEELAEWDGFEPIQPEVAAYLKVRLLSLIEEHKQPFQSILQEDHNQEIEPDSSENCLSQVPVFPSDAWPPIIWEWCQECAASMRIPPDFCCATLLVVLASLIGRKRQIRPEKNNSKWVITPNLWGLIVGRSGLLKTPAMKQVLSGLDDLIQIVMKKHQQAMQEHEVQKENAKVNKLPLPPTPTLKRYKTEDPTIEALGPILRDNPQGILLFRDELQGWLKSMNKKGQENARAFYLETWNASANFTSDRIGRGVIHIPAMCLSVFGGIQPGPIASYVSRMRSGDDNDDGFLQRFQVMVWPKSIPWIPYTGTLDEEMERDIKRIYLWLDQLTFDQHGEPIVLEFSDEAQILFDAWQAKIQPRIRSDEMPEYMASHLSKYPKLLPSIALIIEMTQGAINQVHPKSVSVQSFMMAKEWCEYLEPHAWKIYQCDQVSIIESAKKLIRKVQEGKLPDGFTVREAHHGKHWGGLSDSAQVQKACDYAEGRKWLIKKQQIPTGGRQPDRYYLNPKFPCPHV
jgi:Protein of unknown function (DUF3987)